MTFKPEVLNQAAAPPACAQGLAPAPSRAVAALSCPQGQEHRRSTGPAAQVPLTLHTQALSASANAGGVACWGLQKLQHRPPCRQALLCPVPSLCTGAELLKRAELSTAHLPGQWEGHEGAVRAGPCVKVLSGFQSGEATAYVTPPLPRIPPQDPYNTLQRCRHPTTAALPRQPLSHVGARLQRALTFFSAPLSRALCHISILGNF